VSVAIRLAALPAVLDDPAVSVEVSLDDVEDEVDELSCDADM